MEIGWMKRERSILLTSTSVIWKKPRSKLVNWHLCTYYYIYIYSIVVFDLYIYSMQPLLDLWINTVLSNVHCMPWGCVQGNCNIPADYLFVTSKNAPDYCVHVHTVNMLCV